VLNRSYVYAFDEAGPAYLPAVQLLFGTIKKRWPTVKTLAVLNWAPTPVIAYIDIWVVQYQELLRPDLAAAKKAFLAAKKQVWGYHCCGPEPAQ
jgi:hypothetical protein